MKKNSGKLNLAKKVFAIISALFVPFRNNILATNPLTSENGQSDFDFVKSSKNIVKPKLVLKLRASNINQSRVMMHVSHSSHASHASHASHYSSSSSSYQPHVVPNYEPTFPSKKSNSAGVSTSNNKTSIQTTSKINKSIPSHILGSRTLFKGCHGIDVKELQKLLIGLGYDLIANGIFDELTKVAVEDFQNNNDLTSNGRVGSKTLFVMRSK